MNEMFLCLAASCILFSICFTLLERRRIRKIMGRMEAMVDAAAKGCFQESFFDETQLSRLESALAHYLAANELAVKELMSEKDKVKTLVSDISHQTKTPIANLLLYAELLREERLPQSAAASAIQIYHQADKLRFLISSLVKLSRLETGIVAVNPSPHSASELIRTLSEQYGAAAREKGLELIAEEGGRHGRCLTGNGRWRPLGISWITPSNIRAAAGLSFRQKFVSRLSVFR